MSAAVLAALLLGCNTPPPPLLVLAPGSTRVPVERLVRDWAASQQTDASVVFDDSAALARMVDGGTPADLLLLSDPVRMDGLVDRQHVHAGTRAAIAGDDLAVIASVVAQRPAHDLSTLHRQGRTLLLPPEDSAESIAARALLEDAGLWDDIGARAMYLHDEAAVLARVEADPEAVGILSAGRANLGPNVGVAFTLDAPEPPLQIEGGVVAHAERPETATALLAFLQTPGAEAPFRARGFRATAGDVGRPGGPPRPGAPPPHDRVRPGSPAGPPDPVQPLPGPDHPGPSPDGGTPPPGTPPHAPPPPGEAPPGPGMAPPQPAVAPPSGEPGAPQDAEK
jgi:ABC-type molybdate transport system substrate-binding protein